MCVSFYLVVQFLFCFYYIICYFLKKCWKALAVFFLDIDLFSITYRFIDKLFICFRLGFNVF